MTDILDTVKYVPCHPKNRGKARPASAIQYLVYHYTGNDGDHDTNNAVYYRDNVIQASAHYFVDDDSITQSVDDLGIAWAVGGKKWKDCPQTGGGTLFLTANNYNTLSIEMCDTRRDGKLMASAETLSRATELGRALMKKYNIPIERVIRHFDVMGKHCPAYFMDNQAWDAFKQRLIDDTGTEEDKEMVRYTRLTDIPNEYGFRDIINTLMDAKIINGDGSDQNSNNDVIDLSHDQVRSLVFEYRGGAFDRKLIAMGMPPSVNV